MHFAEMSILFISLFVVVVAVTFALETGQTSGNAKQVHLAPAPAVVEKGFYLVSAPHRFIPRRFNMGAWILPPRVLTQQVSVSFQLFYDELAPYGVWVEYPNYGYVWIPDTDPGFSPYATEGCWVFTDDGWTWVSDYSWGWAAFHYGRWDYDNTYGWFWVPDNEWGPAWVSWRRSPGYYGWAPLRPGISISIAFGREYNERNERWVFVEERNIARRDIRHHYINRSRNVTIINNSTVIVNTRKDNRRNATYIAGPDRDDVQTATRTRINAVAIRENDRPGHRLSQDGLQLYRPLVQKRNGGGENSAPSKVRRLNDLKSATESNGVNRQRRVNPVENRRTDQQSESRQVRPSNNRERQKQPMNAAPSEKNRRAEPSQSRTDQGQKEKKKRER